MADIIRSTKCGSEWGKNELIAYNITVETYIEKDFFKQKLEKISENIDKEFLEFEFTPGRDTPEDNELLGYLDLASRGQESMVDDFAKELLRSMKFNTKGRLIRTRHIIPFSMAGSDTTAQTDVCILRKRDEILLLIQEDKKLGNLKDPEPQVIAEAIATFQQNNRVRENMGMNVLTEMLIPCITMIGTYPTFYLVPVTDELNNCIITGMYPKLKTVVKRYLPIIPRRTSDGMKPIENRKKILQCFEGFKEFVDDIEHLMKT